MVVVGGGGCCWWLVVVVAVGGGDLKSLQPQKIFPQYIVIICLL